ncbi:MAG: SDR family oxidoreductase [Candidatus Sumerlaeia bacterium]|nr:SDR family oxidoreductase [Candidatus Sumerlaeia bacterium]
MAGLDGKVVWVTGSARRVGRAIARACALEGADIVLHCRESKDEGLAALAEMRALGRQAILVHGDHGRREHVERMVAMIADEFGRLDALVNSAAMFPRKPFEQTTEADFDEVIDANLRGPFLCTQLALPLLRRAERAHVINLIDAYLSRPYPNFAAYWCAKGGLDALTRALATELAPRILVNSIAPGPILPPEHYDDEKIGLSADKTLLKRWGSPDDIARAVLFLLESDYVTGTSLIVDGGRSLA